MAFRAKRLFSARCAAGREFNTYGQRTLEKRIQNVEIPQEDLDVLQADDVMERVYVDRSSNRSATLFVAFFNTQKTGKAPHSPKNCLPGSGWAAVRSEIVDIPVPGQPQPIQANRYIVSRGDNQSVVLYWYQSHNRTVASEYWAKYYTIADSIRYNRSDTALVRVVSVVSNGNVDKAIKNATDFAVAFFPQLKQHLPSRERRARNFPVPALIRKMDERS